jgi:cytochrome P450
MHTIHCIFSFNHFTRQDPEVFPEPLTFKPYRWLVGDSAEDRAMNATGKIPLRKNGKALPATLAFLPFGGGPTYCPGRRFARNEIKTLVAVLLGKFDMSVVKGYSTSSSSASGGARGANRVHTSSFFEEEAQGPGFNGARAGLGIFPPKREVLINIKRR